LNIFFLLGLILERIFTQPKLVYHTYKEMSNTTATPASNETPSEIVIGDALEALKKAIENNGYLDIMSRLSDFIDSAPQCQDMFKKEMVARIEVLTMILTNNARVVVRGMELFEALMRNPEEFINSLKSHDDCMHVTMPCKMVDFADGKVKCVKSFVNRLPVFTESYEDALPVKYYIFEVAGLAYWLRISPGANGLQAAVEIFNGEVPSDADEDWWRGALKAASSMAFKVDSEGLVPAGMHPQFGVTAEKKNESLEVMKRVHIKLD